jgi:ABC-type Zn uptake system ZnuABC Zn-binding protein ZnuA
MRRMLQLLLLAVLAILTLAACKTTTDDSSVEGFAEALPLVAGRPTFVFFYTDG